MTSKVSDYLSSLIKKQVDDKGFVVWSIWELPRPLRPQISM